jgi:hypothetical protein
MKQGCLRNPTFLLKLRSETLLHQVDRPFSTLTTTSQSSDADVHGIRLIYGLNPLYLQSIRWPTWKLGSNYSWYELSFVSFFNLFGFYSSLSILVF